MAAANCSIEGCWRASATRGLCNSHYKRLRRYGDPMSGGTFYGEPMRWLNEVALLSSTDDCLLWPYAKAVGYGSVRENGRAEFTHRIICVRTNGEPPSPHHEAAHSCGNPLCCNPRHLRWATSKENCADKKLHGTQPVGEKVGGSRLKEDDVLEMRRLRRCGLTFQEIAAQFEHDIGATRRIIIGETWHHLPL